MMGLFDSAYVVGRRDFVATVYSKTFLIFLIGPLLPIAFGMFFGSMGERMGRIDNHPTVAVVGSAEEFRTIEAAHDRLQSNMDEFALPRLIHAEPDYVPEAQINDLLASRDKKVLAVLTGGMARPKLIGAIKDDGNIRKQMSLILEEARQSEALRASGGALPPLDIAVEEVDESAGSEALEQSATAMMGMGLVFILTMLLATMLLSNMVEEKSSKVIEVLAAAVPVDAIFVGKLFAMLGVSLVGIAVWTAGGLAILAGGPGWAEALPQPAVGWPLFMLLVLLYYSANYMLLGALFLGIGSQAASVREVQTLSMPVTVGQMLIFLFASLAVGPYNGPVGIAAAVFPYSSPLAMISRAAQAPELWTHAAALVWQALWVWITVSFGAMLFRRNVLKSGRRGSGFARLLRR